MTEARRNAGSGTISIIHQGGTIFAETGIVVGGADNAPYAYARSDAPATITLAGGVTGTGGTAIDLRFDGSDVVNLLPGTIFSGAIDFGNGNDGMGGTNPDDIDTLNVADGVNAVVNFADTNGEGQGDTDLQSAPENITGNVALINGGTTAVAIDRTGFAAARTWLESISGAIQLTLGELFPATGEEDFSEQQTAGFKLPGGNQVQPVAHVDATGTGHRLWTSAFGAGRKQEGGSGNLDLAQAIGGLMFGAEGTDGDGFRAGAFAGGSWGRQDVQYNTQTIDVASGFGGLYARKASRAYWVQAMVTGGYMHNDSERRVAAAGGLQVHAADYGGGFVSPALSAGARLAQTGPDHALWGSVRVHYGGLFLDGYTESGAANPLTVRSRALHILGARAQVSSPNTFRTSDGALVTVEGRMGVDVLVDIGGSRVNTVIGGTPFSFNAAFDDQQVSGFLGAPIKGTSADGHAFVHAAAEVHVTDDGSHEVRGQVSAGVRF